MADFGADHIRRSHCRGCGHALGEALISLGPMPLANELITPGGGGESEGQSFPLDVALCPTCGLAQLLDDIRPSRLFEGYSYLTGTSETMSQHFDAYGEAVAEALGGAGARALEIGANDGALLGALKARGLRCLGVEPGAGPASVAKGRGVEIIEAFFDGPEAQGLLRERGPFDGIIANNVLAHVDAPGEVLRACQGLLSPGGRVIVEFPGALALLRGGHWDTIYHEHRSYLSLTALVFLAEGAGLQVLKVEGQAVHGGSLRVWMGHRGSAEVHPSVKTQLEAEAAGGVLDPARWRVLGALAQRQSLALRAYLEEMGGGVIGYGAPAKATVRLNQAGIGPDLLPFTVDRNPWKVGRVIPGAAIPIRGVGDLVKGHPRAVLVFPWNLMGEIRSQIAQALPQGCECLSVTCLGEAPQ